MARARRMVITSELVGRPKRGRGQPKLWAYGYADLAALFGMREGAVRMAVYGKRFAPASLESVVAFAAERRSRR